MSDLDNRMPSWANQRKDSFEPKDPYEFERVDAKRIGGRAHAQSGAGPYQKLDSSNADVHTDNKLTKRKSYSLNRDFWRKRMREAAEAGNKFRESVLFIDDTVPEGHPQRELHVVVVEGKLYEMLQQDSLQLRGLLEAHPELERELNG